MTHKSIFIAGISFMTYILAIDNALYIPEAPIIRQRLENSHIDISIKEHIIEQLAGTYRSPYAVFMLLASWHDIDYLKKRYASKKPSNDSLVRINLHHSIAFKALFKDYPEILNEFDTMGLYLEK